MGKDGKADSNRKTVVVIGADDHNLEMIRAIPEADQWNIERVLEWEDVQPDHGRIDFDDLYRTAREKIDALDDGPDAIIGYLDFPVTSLVALLTRDYGLPGATPEAVACCEHKYWMREIESKVFPETAPEFAAVNPFAGKDARRKCPPILSGSSR